MPTPASPSYPVGDCGGRAYLRTRNNRDPSGLSGALCSLLDCTPRVGAGAKPVGMGGCSADSGGSVAQRGAAHPRSRACPFPHVLRKTSDSEYPTEAWGLLQVRQLPFPGPELLHQVRLGPFL